MKINVKFLMPFALLLLGVFSCEKEEQTNDDAAIAAIVTADNLAAINTTDLPEISKEYIDYNYFDTYVEEAEAATGKGYRAVLGNGETLYFGTDGEVMEFEGTVLDRGPFGGVHPHGPCFRLRRWLRGHHGNHDCNGDGRPDGPFAYDIDELPETITDYVTENYPDNTIRRAAFRDDQFIILVGVRVILSFDADGNFIEELSPLRHCSRHCNSLTREELPETVSAYIVENYAEATFGRACDTLRGTIVFLTNGEQRVFLGFNEDGELVFERP